MAAVHHLCRPPCTMGNGTCAPSSAESVHHEAGINAPWPAECLHHRPGVRSQDGIISLRSVNDPEKSYPSKLYEFIHAEEGVTVFVVIEEGDTLVLPCPYTITIHGGFVFE